MRLPALVGCLALLALGATGSVSIAARDNRGGVDVCVVAPRIESLDGVDAYGIVLTPQPMLVVVEPLLELQIQRQQGEGWRRAGSRSRPLLTPLAWPTEPIGPDEPVLLQLRPLGAGPEAFAHVQLLGASAQRMGRTAGLIESLGGDPGAWLASFEQALESSDVPLAWALLFDRRSPRSPDLDALRRRVIERGCGD